MANKTKKGNVKSKSKSKLHLKKSFRNLFYSY